jgi:hypothetical protein
MDEDFKVSDDDAIDPPDPEWLCLGDGLLPLDSGGCR